MKLPFYLQEKLPGNKGGVGEGVISARDTHVPPPRQVPRVADASISSQLQVSGAGVQLHFHPLISSSATLNAAQTRKELLIIIAPG